jgi:DNA-binding transcriptional MerR regulator
MDGDERTRTWRIGELAAMAHVSVRTLRHYGAVGLLAPAARTRPATGSTRPRT